MANEVTEAIQLLELVGHISLFAGKTLVALPGGVRKIVQNGQDIVEGVKIRHAQFHMLAQFKNPDKYETLSLKDMEILTGGDYRILRIPIEKGGENYEEYARKFCEAMKVRKIPYSVMPDIHIGDGQMEIAVNPQDSDKLHNLLQEFDWPLGKSAKDISFDEYFDNAKREDYAAYQNEAVQNAEEIMKNYERKIETGIYPITADEILWKSNEYLKEKGEREGNMYIRIPGTAHSDTGPMYMCYPKSEYQIINNGKTIAAEINLNQEYQLCDAMGRENRRMQGNEIAKNWNEAAQKVRQRNGRSTVVNRKKIEEGDIAKWLQDKNMLRAELKTDNILHIGDQVIFLHNIPGLEIEEFIAVNRKNVILNGDVFSLNIYPEQKYNCVRPDGAVTRELSGNTLAKMLQDQKTVHLPLPQINTAGKPSPAIPVRQEHRGRSL